MEVTTANVYDYVRKYAEYRMVKSEEKALQVCIVINVLIIANIVTMRIEYLQENKIHNKAF